MFRRNGIPAASIVPSEPKAKKKSRLRGKTETHKKHVVEIEKESPNHLPHLGLSLLFGIAACGIPFIWLPAVASTFLLLPLCFLAGYVIFLEICKLGGLWPFEPRSGVGAILSWFNPISYLLTPGDFVKSTKKILSEWKALKEWIWSKFPSWSVAVKKDIDETSRDFKRRYFDSKAPLSRDFNSNCLQGNEWLRNTRHNREKFGITNRTDEAGLKKGKKSRMVR